MEVCPPTMVLNDDSSHPPNTVNRLIRQKKDKSVCLWSIRQMASVDIKCGGMAIKNDPEKRIRKGGSLAFFWLTGV